MPNTFFTSDLHFGHEKIIEYCKRPWKSVEEMNEALIENFNSRVTPQDDVFVLGDFSFKIKKDEASEILSRLNGNKHLISGNHDINWVRRPGWGSVSQYKEISRDGNKLVLCHYPLAEWNGDANGAYMLHGHGHNLRDYNLRQRCLGIRRFDVGVEANNYMPVEIEEIFDFFKDSGYRRCWYQTWIDFKAADFAKYEHG